MPNDRLTLALEMMGPGDWLTFERFAAEFNAIEFPSLRTTAAAAGDKGRDGQLFLPHEDVTTAFQYSVTADWTAKIRSTVATLGTTLPSVKRLIYCTNQAIGPAGDDLATQLRKGGIALDIRDRSWFVDRELTHPQREIASQEIAEHFVKPLLEARGIAERVARALPSDQARVALLHLALEGYDQTTDKGLTRSCFESLVRSVLHNTDSSTPMTFADILACVSILVPVGDEEQVRAQVLGALNRLSVRGGPVKQVGKTQSYHLSFEEQEKLRSRVATFLLESAQVDAELKETLKRVGLTLDNGQLCQAVEDLRAAVDATLLARGEDFATAVVSGSVKQLDTEQVLEVLNAHSVRHVGTEEVIAIVLDLLESPAPATRRHLRRLADGYTLFAFLRQTPDVQKVVLAVFREGDVWLDTNVILPLLIETLLDSPAERNFTTMLRASRDAGLRFFVTEGIVEEVERHLNRCLAFARIGTNEWHGRVPFVYAGYALSGRARASFATWLEEFRGDQTPEQDIQEFLADEFGITLRNLTHLSDQADPLLRAAVQEFWHSVHFKRRGAGPSEITPANTLRLVEHDVENCVGVMEMRRETPMGPMGYKAWWLTLDRSAFGLETRLKAEMVGPVPKSPALSPDFLVELLRLGPLRSAIERDLHVSLPVMTDIGRYESLPVELIQQADRIRQEASGLSERIVARRVRDELNRARWRPGTAAQGGSGAVKDLIDKRLEAQAGRS